MQLSDKLSSVVERIAHLEKTNKESKDMLERFVKKYQNIVDLYDNAPSDEKEVSIMIDRVNLSEFGHQYNVMEGCIVAIKQDINNMKEMLAKMNAN